jgi:hypothetical protein
MKARLNKDAAKTAAVSMEREAQMVVASAQLLFGTAPVAKERVAVEAIKSDLNGLQDGLTTIHKLIDRGTSSAPKDRQRPLR